ncbi:MAG: glycosyltransferase family 87 protein [bacterium]
MSKMTSTTAKEDRTPVSAILAVAGMAVLARVVFHGYTGFTFDDAFITFRYAENLAAGHGFVYNLSERVLGTTSPLFTFLLAGLAYLKAPVPLSALVVSLAASAVTAVLILRIAEGWRFGRYAIVPALIYALLPRLLPTDTGGMETALFTSMIVAAFYLLQFGRFRSAMVTATLATLVRPEGGLLVFLVLVAAFIRNRKGLVGCFSLALLIGLPWLVFAQSYFGNVIPHSITAKLALYGDVWTRSFAERLIFVMGWHSPLGWCLSALGVWGAILVLKSERDARYPTTWLVLSLGLLLASTTKIFIWYLSPLYPLWLIIAAAPVVWAGQRFVGRGRMMTIGAGLVGVLALTILVASDVRSARYYRLDETILTTIHSDLVQYIEVHGSPSDTVATEDIGYVGYHSDNYILDRAGLVSKRVPAMNRSGHYGAVISESFPNWVIVSPWDPTSDFLGSKEFIGGYSLCGIFSHPDNRKWEFLLFERRKSAVQLGYCPGR